MSRSWRLLLLLTNESETIYSDSWESTTVSRSSSLRTAQTSITKFVQGVVTDLPRSLNGSKTRTKEKPALFTPGGGTTVKSSLRSYARSTTYLRNIIMRGSMKVRRLRLKGTGSVAGRRLLLRLCADFLQYPPPCCSPFAQIAFGMGIDKPDGEHFR